MRIIAALFAAAVFTVLFWVVPLTGNFLHRMTEPYTFFVYFGLVLVTGIVLIATEPERYIRDDKGDIVADRKAIVAEIGGVGITRETLCQHILVTGDTGSGKTLSGLNPILWSLFKHSPTWGGMVLDYKGSYWRTVQQMAKAHGREDDLILITVDPWNATGGQDPKHRFNPLTDISVPFAAHSRAIIDAGLAMSGGGKENSFFITRSDAHLARLIELLHELGQTPTFHRLNELISNKSELQLSLEALQMLPTQTRARHDVINYFSNTLLRFDDSEQTQGELSTVQTYLQYFVSPPIRRVFCSEQPNTFSMDDLDRGKILCLSIPPEYAMERQYITTMFKLLFYRHARSREKLSGTEILRRNLLCLMIDEWQEFITSSDNGDSDYKAIATLRSAGVSLIGATQGHTSLIPPHGDKNRAAVLFSNLRNRVIFRAASEECAKHSAEFIGKHKTEERTETKGSMWGGGNGGGSVSVRKRDEFIMPPYELMKLKNHEAVIKLASKAGHTKKRISPINGMGRGLG